MGRCNNRRVQQAALASRNTPSRARFSKGPPKKSGGRGGGRGGRERGGRGGGRAAGDGRGHGGRTTESHAKASRRSAVVDKISKRVEEKSSNGRSATFAPATSRARHPLDRVDISRLDEITLSEESIQHITRLLQTLNVMESSEAPDDSDEEQEKNEIDQKTDIDIDSRRRSRGGYEESTEDYDDTEEGGFVPIVEEENNAFSGQVESGDPPTDDDEQEFRDSPLFKQLTTKFSFSQEHALRACRGIENWDALPKDGDKKDSPTPSAQNSTAELLSLAMDWLCLHLTDEELVEGFKTRPVPKSSTGVLPVGSGKTNPIPHPSISVAKPLTTDTDWKEHVIREGRKVGFLRLGFSYIEAEMACDQTPPPKDPTVALNDQIGLRELLLLLERRTYEENGLEVPAPSSLSDEDLTSANEEREQEVEALEAIYEGDFDRRKADYYVLKVMPVDDLQKPANSDDCKLHFFLRKGYPVFLPPLVLFTNPTLPPSLLRRINVALVQQIHDTTGEPSVFTAADFVANSLGPMQSDFVKEQRRKEMELEQIRMRKEAGHDIEAMIENQYETNGNIGRRQRAKLKAAEKAYDRNERLQQEELERRRKQEERTKRAQHENREIRATMADRAIADRNTKWVHDQAEKAARAAMNNAFNAGASTEEARAAAKRARIQSLRFNGEDASSDEDGASQESADEEVAGRAANPETDDGEETPSAPTAKTVAFMRRLSDKTAGAEPKSNGATPQTKAFMERLREVYKNAAGAKTKSQNTIESVTEKHNDEEANPKVQVVLSKPELEKQEQDETVYTPSHVPEPIPIATGDLASVMKSVLQVQEEQPWLISSEARVPIQPGFEGDPPTAPNARDRDKKSRSLKRELENKLTGAEQWGKDHGVDEKAMRSKGGPRNAQFYKMLSQRRKLPTFVAGKEIVETIHRNRVTVVSADTGAGKTTQAPQLVLDDMIMNGRGAEANMIVTQPRRISAIGVAERIAAERCERVGETVGYSIRLENRRSNKTRVLLCTTGILLRRLQCDPDLASVSHVFVDEVHERDLNTDFLLIILKDLLARRKSLKLVLMSATLNANAFSEYFDGCPVVSIPGRAHPVKEHRLEDILQLTGYEVQPDSDFALKLPPNKQPRFSKSALRKMYYPKYDTKVIGSLSVVDETVINYELLADLLEYITLNTDEGAILVFMPGMMEITKAIEELYKKEFFQSSKVVVYPLHSSLSTTEQTAVFDVPPEGVRKIVVATNIAETSITIEDVVYVVDTGRVKENRKDEINEMPTLVECWVSRASAKQRRGRAGRVRPGIAYHMFSSHTFEEDLQEYQLPEMLRVGLEDLVLQILLLDLGEPTSFLAKAVNPPSALAMKNSLKLLESLGAVEVEWTNEDALRRITSSKSEDVGISCDGLAESGLTALGFHLATLPVDPRVGKMMIYGGLFGCTDPSLTIAASMSAKSPFLSPFDKRDQADEAKRQFATDGSDHLTVLTAFQEWKRMRQQKGDKATQRFLHENFLSRLTLFQMEDLRRQFGDLLKEIGFLPKEYRVISGKGRKVDTPNVADANSSNMALVKAVLCAGLYPNILVAPRNLVGAGRGEKEAGECAFQSSKGEVHLHPCTVSFSQRRLESRYCCYHDMVKTKKTYVRDCTTVSEFALLLFGGSLKVYHTRGVVTIDGWLKFRIGAKPATLVKHLRAQMERMLLKKILNPQENVTESDEGKALIEAVSTLLEREKTSLPDGAEIVRPWNGGERGASRGRGGQDRSRRCRGNRGER